jgi:hypothetical protein
MQVSKKKGKFWYYGIPNSYLDIILINHYQNEKILVFNYNMLYFLHNLRMLFTQLGSITVV